MRARSTVATMAVALFLTSGAAACGDDDVDDNAPGSESEIDGSEAGTGGDSNTSTTTPAGTPPGDMTTGGATGGGTEGNQIPPAG